MVKPTLLNMDYINSLPLPLFAILYGDWGWPVYDIEVETGLLRLDVCGLLQVEHIDSIKYFRDAEGTRHDGETFYSDYVLDDAERLRGGGSDG
jgi:hypothetical protein